MGIPFASQISVRSAERRDAPLLARLADMAGDGLPSHLWAKTAAPGESPFAVGEARVRRDGGAFSWRNARVATWHGCAVGAVIDYDLDGFGDPGDVAPVLAPLLELEALSAGTRYVNVLAVLPAARRIGMARALLGDLFSRTKRDLSLIVASENRVARAFYFGAGFGDVTRLAMAAGGPPDLRGSWHLMRRPATANPTVRSFAAATVTRSGAAA